MDFKLNMGSLRFESGNGQTCSTCDTFSYSSTGETMLVFDIPDEYGSTTCERVCTKCMWNTFKTVIKLLNSGKKLI